MSKNAYLKIDPPKFSLGIYLYCSLRTAFLLDKISRVRYNVYIDQAMQRGNTK